ncbi:MAG: hypothetical protein IT165_20865 [Bryobacterales bacterium]|nr:hypothetical protein [Bryobacterales bacterium]
MSVYGYIQRDWREPQLATWNLTFERQLGASWVARIAYAGNKGTYLASGALGFRESNPAVYIPGASTTGNTQSRRINPNFGPVGLFSSDNNSHYHSVRFNIEKRYAHGLTILGNYTFSKMMDDFGNSGTTNPFNRRFDYGRSNDDVPHVFHFSGVWQIPNMPLHGLAGRLINGWSLSGVNTWSSGFPISITSGKDNSLSGVGADRADYVGGAPGLDTGRSHADLIQQYFNVSAFTFNAPGTFGNSGKNILRSPRSFNTDMGVLKDFRANERMAFQFRTEFFNVFNNVNFSAPSTNLASASVGKITSAANPRILQLALKFRF